jgi:hypothetical protein
MEDCPVFESLPAESKFYKRPKFPVPDLTFPLLPVFPYYTHRRKACIDLIYFFK